jgi:hypothetical protein
MTLVNLLIVLPLLIYLYGFIFGINKLLEQNIIILMFVNIALIYLIIRYYITIFIEIRRLKKFYSKFK